MKICWDSDTRVGRIWVENVSRVHCHMNGDLRLAFTYKWSHMNGDSFCFSYTTPYVCSCRLANCTSPFCCAFFLEVSRVCVCVFVCVCFSLSVCLSSVSVSQVQFRLDCGRVEEYAEHVVRVRRWACVLWVCVEFLCATNVTALAMARQPSYWGLGNEMEAKCCSCCNTSGSTVPIT